MAPDLSPEKDAKLVPIGEAAEILGVSIDTVRRWDKKGILHSSRPDGKRRFFSTEELERVKFARPLTITQAAQQLGVSADTLRRLEDKGIITPERNNKGERLYTQEVLKKYLDSEYFMRQKEVQEKILEPLKDPEHRDDLNEVRAAKELPTPTLETEQKVITQVLGDTKRDVTRLDMFRRAFYAGGVFLGTTAIIAIIVITGALMLWPEATGGFFGFYRVQSALVTQTPSRVSALGGQVLGIQQDVQGLSQSAADIELVAAPRDLSVPARVLQPFGRVSLELVKQLNKDAYDRAITVVTPEYPAPPESLFITTNEGTIIPRHPLTFDTTSDFIIPDNTLVQNLNAQYLQGKVPGTEADNLLLLNNEGNIEFSGFINSESVTTSSLIDQSVTGDKIAVGVINSLHLGPDSVTRREIKDGEVLTPELADGAVTDEKLADDAVTEAKIAQGAVVALHIRDEAVLSIAIKDGTIVAADIAQGAIITEKLAADAVTSEKIKNGEVGNADLADDSVTTTKIREGGVTTTDIAEGAVGSEQIADGGVENVDVAQNAIESDNIADNNVSAADLAAALTFADGDFIDLAAITHDDSALQGLRLPNVASGAPTNPSSGEGYVAWNTAGNEILLYDGSSWVGLTSTGGIGDITRVGDCTAGECFSGTQGTTLTFNDADGDGVLTIANLTGARTYTLPDASGTVIVSGHTLTGDVTGTVDSDGSTALTTARINGATLGTTTATAGNLLLGDGDSWESVVMSGDITITSAGVASIGADKVTEADLKVVDTGVDEECLTYETTTGDFEWEPCVSGDGGISSFTVAGDSGSPQTITDGNTLTIATGPGLSTEASATDTITIRVDNDAFDFDEFEDTLDLDAALVINQGSQTWAQNYTGTTDDGYTYTATSLTTGTGLDFNVTNAATTNTAIEQVQFDLTNAQATLANANFVGYSINFSNTPSVAGNTEIAARIQNQQTGNTTDNTVTALLLLDNADTADAGSTVVTDALRITNSGGIAGGVTRAINIASTSITTDISLQNGETIDNDTDGRVLITATTTETSGNLTVSGTSGLSLAGTGGDITFANGEKIDNDTDGTVAVTGNASVSGDLTVTGNDISFGNAETISNSTDGTIAFTDGTNTLMSIVDAGTTGNVNISGDLTISGDDLFMATNTSGFILVADGTNFNPVDASGDVDISSAGVLTIQANSVALTTDTTGDYVATVAAGSGISTTGAATGEGITHTISVSEINGSNIADDSLDYVDFEDTMDLDAALVLNQGTNTWTQNFTGTTGDGYTYNANSLTTGDALSIVSTATGITSGELLNIDLTSSGSLTAKSGSLTSVAGSRTNTATTGTVADDYDLFALTRTSVQNGASGTLTATGSVLRLENVATQTAGTLTDSARVLELVQDADSSGNALGIAHAGSGDAVFVGDDGTLTDATPFVISASGSVGIGTASPDAKVHSLATTEQLRLGYDASNYASFTTSSGGNLTIGSTGLSITLGTNSHTITLPRMTASSSGLLPTQDLARDLGSAALQWRDIFAGDGFFSGTVGIGSVSPEALLEIQGAEATDAVLALDADDGDDAADTWFIKSLASGNSLSFLNDATEVFNVSSGGNVQLDGDLTISGDDLVMGTNTSGYILVADGTNFNPVAMSGDITILSTGATAIGDDKVTEADLKVVDAGADEECLTYETTTGDFEWEPCVSGAGGISSFTLAGDAGTPQTISDSDTLTVATGAHLTATAGVTDTVTLSVDDDTFDFDQFQDTLDLDASLVLNQGTNTWTQNFTGTTTDGYTYNANSLTTGDALSIVSTATGITSGELLNIDLTSSGSLTAKTGNLASVAGSRTNTATSGTVADDYDLFALTRTSVQNGASGTLTAAGSVLRLENVATQTAGTLTDSARVLELVQDADSSGNALGIAHAGSGDAVFIGDDGTLTDSTPFVVQADGDVGIGTGSPATLLHLHTAAGSSPTLRLTDADVAHGITLFGRTTDTIYDVSAYSATSGGAIHWGMSSAASIPALTFWGVVGNTSPSVAPVAFSAGKKNGSTVQPLASSEKAFTFYNSADGDIPGATLLTILGGGNVGIGSTSPEALLEVQGAEATDAVLALDADDGDDAADTWFLESNASDNSFSFTNGVTEVANLTSGGNLQIDGDLTISGDDLVMGTNTSGMILVADGTNFNPVAMSGDITILSTGATAIGDDKVTEADLKVVDTGADEECLTYETTTGDFEWEPCVSGAGGISSFTLAGDAGTPQTISDSDTLTVATGAHLTATAGATDTVTLSVDDDTFDFDQFQDTLDLDAALTVNQGTNTWTQNFTGTTGDGLTYNANSLTTGDALSIVSTATGMTSGELLNIDLTSSGSLSAKTGNLTSVAGSRTNTATTGTVADDYDLLALTRTNVQNGAGGTLTAAGSVLRLENVATQTAGTLTDSARVLEIVQDADSSGNSLGIAHAGSGDAVFIGDDGTLTDSTPFVIQADGDVGIGTASPSTTLDVAGFIVAGDGYSSASLDNDNLIQISSDTNNEQVGVELYSSEGTNNRRATFYLDDAAAIYGFNQTYTTGAMEFNIAHAGTSNFRIDSTGDVGIGTTSPDGKLTVLKASTYTSEVAGGIFIRSSESVGTKTLLLGADNANSISYIQASSYGSSFVSPLALNPNGGNVGILDISPDASLEVVNDGSGDSFLVADTNDGDTTPFVINSTGDVGIGTASPAAKLHVKGSPGSLSQLLIDSTTSTESSQLTLAQNGTGRWAFHVPTSTTDLRFYNYTLGSDALSIASATGNVTVGADLTISGDDLFMATNTSGFILVADGTNYNPVAVSGDATLSSSGALTIDADELDYDQFEDTMDLDAALVLNQGTNTWTQNYTGTTDDGYTYNANSLTTGDALSIVSTATGITSGELLNIDLTSSGSLTAKTGNLTSVASSRTNTATAGTIADDYDLLNLTRTSVQNGASGTLTAAGSVLRLENVATQTAGTLTDTTKGLEVVMDTDGTGDAVFIDSNAAAAIALNIDAENTTADAVNIDTTATSGIGLDVVASSLTNGSGLRVYSNSASASARSLLFVHNDNTSATGAQALLVQQDAAGVGVIIDQNGEARALYIDAENTAADIVDIDGTQLTTGDGLQISLDSDNATTGQAIRVFSGATASTQVFSVDEDGDTVMAGDLTISGDDLFMATNTSGYLLVADGTNFNPVAMSGDITIDSAGITAIGADKVTEADLKVVNGATDEYCFTYEATTGDFEWEECVSGAGGLSSFTLAGDAGTPQTISDGNTLTVATGAGLTATASATDTVTVSVDEDAFDFDEFEDTLDLDAALTLNQGTNTWTQNFTGTTGDGLTYNANSLTTGKALNITSSSGVITSGELFTTALTSSGSSLSAKTGNLSSVSSSRTETRTTGTTADDYDLLNLTRTSVMNGAGGTLTAAGSVLRLENVATQTAGTLTDTAKVLELVQDADSTGAVFHTTNAGTGTDLHLANTNAGADGVSIVFHHDSASPAAADVIADIDFSGEDSLGNETDYAQIQTISTVVTDGSEDGELAFSAMLNGTLTEAFRIDDQGYIGIGTTSPNEKLEVASGNIRIGASDNYLSFGSSNMRIQGSNSGGNLDIVMGSAAGTAGGNNTGLRIWSNALGAIRTEIDSSGNIQTDGDLTISGDDLVMATNTSGFILVADGTNYNPVAVSGDATLSSSGVFTIDADEIDFDQMEDTMDLDANLAINTTGFDVVWNEDGGDSDFRIEGDTNANLFFSDASADSIGIGDSTPDAMFDIDSAATSGTVSGLTADSLTTGKGLHITSASGAITSGELFTTALTSSGSLSAKSGNLTSIAGSRTNTATSGTIADDYDLFALTRTSVQNGASGTLTAAGSVLRLENVATQTAGTLTDSARVLEIVQDADSSGNALGIAHAGSGDAVFIGDDGTLTDSTPFVIQADGDVGIGTTAPQLGKLEVVSANQTIGAGFAQVVAASSDAFAIDKGGQIILAGTYQSASPSVLVDYGIISGRKENATDGNYAGYLAFATRANGIAATEKMRITSAGLVGINDTTPDAQLDVVASSASTKGLIVQGAASAAVNLLEVQDSSGNAVVYVGTSAAGSQYRLIANNAEAGGSKSTSIQFGGGGYLDSQWSETSRWGSGVYADAGTLKYNTDSGNAVGALILGSGTLQYQTGTSTGGGNAASMTEVLNVSTGGNLQIDGDLTISGDDLVMGTNTSGFILVADGTNYNPVAVSGDATLSSAGALTIDADEIDFDQMEDTMDLDANLAVNTTGFDVVWNEDGGDSDFRIEGDTEANLLFVDASTDRIGIGTATPDTRLDIRGTSGTTLLSVGTSSDNSDAIAIRGQNAILTAPDGALVLHGNSGIYIQTAGANRGYIDTAGLFGFGTVSPGALVDADRPDASSITAEQIGLRVANTAQTLTDGTSITNWRNVQMIAPTLNGVAAGGTETVTNAATAYIDAAPSGSNITITNPYAFWVDNGAVRFDNESLGTTSTDGLALINNTAAAAGAQQYSPRLRLTGQGWKTDATAASQTVDFILQTVPVQGTANPTAYLDFSKQVNGGGYSNVMAITSAGNVGIGETAPAAKLVVNGDMLLGNADGNSGHSLMWRGRTDLGFDEDVYSLVMSAPEGVRINLDSNANGTSTLDFQIAKDVATKTGGTLLFTIVESTGLVGIGSDTSPDASLEIINDGSGDSLLVEDTNDGDTTPFVIDASGNVGVGTGSPGNIFDISSNSSTRIPGIRITDTNASGRVYGFEQSRSVTGLFELRDMTASATRLAVDSSGDVGIGSTSPEALLEVQGVEATDAIIALDADDGDDLADTWFIESEAADNDLSFVNNTTEALKLTSGGNLTTTGDLTITGDDLFMATNTSGFILVADGTNYNPVAVSGDATLSSAGVLTLSSSSVGSAEITDDSLDYVDFEDTMDLDAALTLNQTTNTWSQTFTGDTSTGYSYAANSLTTGKALNITSSSGVITSGELFTTALTSSGSSLSAKTGNLSSISSSRTETRTTGTTADDYDLLGLTRTNVMNGSGGTLTAAGSVLRLENVATQTAGTLTDSARVLEIMQDADSSGNALGIAHAGSGDAVFIGDDGTLTDSTPFVIQADGDVGIGTTAPGYKLDVSLGATTDLYPLSLTSSGKFVRIGALNGTYAHVDTDATSGFYFYDTVETGSGNNRFSVSSGDSYLAALGGKVGIGSTTFLTFDNSLTPRLQVSGTDLSTSSSSGARFSADAGGPQVRFGKSRGASIGTYTIVQSGDELGVLRFNGADGVDLDASGAAIRVAVDGTPGSNDLPGRLMFDTTADGAMEPTERLRIESSGDVGIGSTAPEALLEIQGVEATDAVIALDADDGDDAADTWFVKSLASGNSLSFLNDATEVMNLTSAGALQIDSDLTISGDDLFMGTNTSGFILVADGTNYNPVAMSGDITIDSTGATAIGADKVTEADLKVVDTPLDEECLTKEDTTGDFEWQSCGMTSFTLAGTLGTPQTISNADTVTIAAGTGITTTAGATDTVTVAATLGTSIAGSEVDDDTLDYVDFEDTMDLDAALVLNQSTNTWSQNFTGTTTTGLSYTASSLTTGTALQLTATNTSTTATAIAPLKFDLTNAQSTSAATYHGLQLQFLSNPSVAGNTEEVLYVANFATSNTTDNAVAALLRLDNGDTSTTGSTVVTDGIRITNSGDIAGGITNAINIDDTDITNDIVLQNDEVIHNDTNGTIAATGAILRVGTGADSATNRSMVTLNNGGYAAPAAPGSTSDGDKFVLYDPGATYRVAIGMNASARMWFQSISGATGGFSWYTGATPTEIAVLDGSGNLQIDADLTISGDDLVMGTNTSGFILVADGTNYNPVAMSGDITITSTGATSIGADKVLEADLKAVDAAVDEECLTFETTTGDFEWQTCGGGGTTLQSAYDADVDGTDATIALTTADDSLVISNPASSGSDSAYAMLIDQNDTLGAAALQIDSESTDQPALYILSASDGTNSVTNAGIAVTAESGAGAAYFYSNVGLGMDDNLVEIVQDNTAGDQVALWVQQDSTTVQGVLIDHNGNGEALFIDAESTSEQVIEIIGPTTTTGQVFHTNADSLTTGKILDLTSNSSSTSTRTLVQITNDNTLATGATALSIQQDANQLGMFIDQNGTGTAHGIQIDSEATTGNAIVINHQGDASNNNAAIAITAENGAGGLSIYRNAAAAVTDVGLVSLTEDEPTADTHVVTILNDGTGFGLLVSQNGNGSDAINVGGSATTGNLVHLNNQSLTTGNYLTVDFASALTTGKILDLQSNSASTSARSLVSIIQDNASATSAVPLRVQQDSTADIIEGFSTTTEVFTVEDSGRIFTNDLTAPGADPMCWDASGGSYIGDCTSSIEFKENVTDLSFGLEILMQLRPREFDWKESVNGNHDFGFIAQEVAAVKPLIATYRDGEIRGVKYQNMASLLTKGIQEQQGQIMTLADLLGADLAALSVQAPGQLEETFAARLENLEARVAGVESEQRSLLEAATEPEALEAPTQTLPANVLTDAVFSQDLVFSGALTADSNMTIAGMLTVKADVSLLATLTVDTVEVAKSLTVHGDTTIFGKLTAESDVEVKGTLSVSEQQAGFAAIPRGGNTVEVTYPKAYIEAPLVQITPQAPIGGGFWISAQSATGFSITLEKLSDTGVTFNWFTLPVAAPATAQGQAVDSDGDGILDIDEAVTPTPEVPVTTPEGEPASSVSGEPEATTPAPETTSPTPEVVPPTEPALPTSGTEPTPVGTVPTSPAGGPEAPAPTTPGTPAP